jgi:hypothetical protein
VADVQPENLGDVPPFRVPKTHLPNLLDKIKSLPLKLKLSMNKNIEQANFTRAERAYKHALDPVANPDPGSEAASMITISSEEMSSLSASSVMSALMSVMPLYLLQTLSFQDKDKRKREDSLTQPQLWTHALQSVVAWMDPNWFPDQPALPSKLLSRKFSSIQNSKFLFHFLFSRTLIYVILSTMPLRFQRGERMENRRARAL